MTPQVSNGLLAAAATNSPLAAAACDASYEAPSVYEISTPTPLMAITIDTVDGLLTPRLYQASLVPSAPWTAPPSLKFGLHPRRFWTHRL
ncbi:UNVERIFIED_CONTAM: hypothetical protein Sangu_3198500 [Sesamum angustifolium]|uniref:Uncharacterized protein n=1 Tax=Sesamum angustifolium TaxID=2727405 RepID=A0AAW2JM55_9LAMI